MSALGHKRTFAAQKGMAALPPKADMCGATRYVRFVPKADILICVFRPANRAATQSPEFPDPLTRNDIVASDVEIAGRA